VQLIVHEARHAEGPEHTCGPNDMTIDELGAWGAVYYFSRALAFDSDACFLRPALPPSPRYDSQLFAADAYLVNALEYSREVHRTRFCAEPTAPVEPREPVLACGG
jgi:hypothetical protein